MSDYGLPGKRIVSLIPSLTLTLLLAAACAAPAQVQQAPGDLSHGAWRLATDGRLGELWDQIDTMSADQPHLVSLQREVSTYRRNQTLRRQQQRQAFDAAMDKLAEHREAGELTKALTNAVEAHGLSEHPDEFLQGQAIRELIEQAETQARSAEEAGEWFGALILYRRLDLLFDDHDTYREDLDRVSRRLRQLRLYVPEVYNQQADDYARSQGEEPGEHWAGEGETGWEEELAGIDTPMLIQALTRASDRHVSNARIDQMFVGGIDALRAMLRNHSLAATFPSLADEKKVEQFDKRLLALRSKVDGRFTIMGYSDAASRFNIILDDNRKTLDLPERMIIHEFADGAMSTLDDFSAIVWPDEMEHFRRTTKLEFSGVRVQITLTDEELTVVSPLEGTPAHRAGLKAGDRIVTIDGKNTVGISLQQAVRAITGPEGTTVKLGLQQPGRDEVREVALVRSTIKIHSIKGFSRLPGGLWDYWVDPANRIGYIRITQFGPDTVAELDQAVAQMRFDQAVRILADAGIESTDIVKIVGARDIDAGHPGVGAQLGREQREKVEALLRQPHPINGLVLDLRFNPGGLLKSAVDVSNRFVDRGVIVSGDTGGSRDEWTANADPRDTYEHFPVVCLINKGSASASEIVSGCLQDHRRGLIIGENSYGKGSVQQLFPLKFDQALVKITTQYYKLPSGRIIHRRPDASSWGVKPDVQVDMTDMQVEDLIRARMVIDVLRDDDERINAEAVIGAGDPNNDPNARIDDQPVPESAREVLERGFDPQLETGVLLLKARLIGDLVAG